MRAAGAVVRLASRRLTRVVMAAMAPGVLVNLAWTYWLGLFPWAMGAIGTAMVLVTWVGWTLVPYAVLLCPALLVSQYVRRPALRLANLVLLVVGALLLDASTAYVAWATQGVLRGKAAIYTYFATPLLELLELLIVWAPLWGLVLAVTALAVRAARALRARPVSAP